MTLKNIKTVESW